MKIYQIIGHPLDCEGHSLLPKVLKAYTKYIDAIKFKDAWEEAWNKHTDNNELLSPCWYDYMNWVNIEEIEVEENFSGI